MENFYSKESEAKAKWINDISCVTATNMFWKFMYGNYDSVLIPSSIIELICGVEDVHWRSFLVLLIIVMHNHRIVTHQKLKERVYLRSKLMNLRGVTGKADVPAQPYGPDFFQEITVQPLPGALPLPIHTPAPADVEDKGQEQEQSEQASAASDVPPAPCLHRTGTGKEATRALQRINQQKKRPRRKELDATSIQAPIPA